MQDRIVKKQIVMDLDKNGAPSNPRFIVDRIITFDDGSDDAIISGVVIPLTPEEVTAHISEAVARQAADIAADGAAREALRVERDAAEAKAASMEAQRDTALATAAQTEDNRVKAVGERDVALAKVAELEQAARA